MDNDMKFLVGLLPFIFIFVFNFLFDLILANSYHWCKKKNCGKACRIWNCKNYRKCMQKKDIMHGLLILDSSKFSLVLEDGRKVPVPNWIPEDAFPVMFTNGETDLEFKNIEHLEEFSLIVYDKLYEKPNKLNQRTK